MNKLLCFVVLIGLGFGFYGCDKEDEEETSGSPTKVNIPKIETSISANHPDVNARSLKTSVESLNYMSGMFMNFYEGFEGYEWVKNGNLYTYQETYGTESFKYTVLDNGSTYTTKFYISGDMGGFTINNGLMFEGTYTKDGKSGSWKVYDFVNATSSFVDVSYEWSTSTAGVLTSLMKMWDSATDQIPDSYEVTLNSDKSGTSIFKEDGLKIWSGLWAVDGSGEQKYYNESGEVTETFTWTKNP
ncbi:MAG: hypothetical protein J0L62_01110 [Bacteroidetes bacterium]|nr:hypothetical protein [Bacteroidota bacterium]